MQTEGARGERPIPARPSAPWTVAATVAPSIVSPMCLAPLVVTLGRGFSSFLHDGGRPSWFVLGAFVAGVPTLMLLGSLAARGVRAPSVAALVVAALPWIVGLAGMRLGVHHAAQAAPMAALYDRSGVMVRGAVDAMTCRALGAWCTLALAAGASLCLALAAVAQRDPARRGALAAAAASAAALGTVAAVVGSGCVRFDDAWIATANVDAASKLAALAAAGGYLVAADARALVALGIGLVVVLAVSLASWRASRPTTAAIVGGAVVVVVLLLSVGLDRWATTANGRDVARVVAPPWSGIDGFAPVAIAGPDTGAYLAVDVVIGLHTVAGVGGRGAPLTHEALVAAFARVVRRERAAHGGDRLDDDEGRLHDPILDRAAPVAAVALDRRLRGGVLRDVVIAANEAGVHSLSLVGRAGTLAQIDADERLFLAAPAFLRAAVWRPAAVLVALDGSVPAGYADADRALLHLTATDAARQRFVPRAGDATPPVELALDEDAPFEGNRDDVVSYVAIAYTATAERLVQIAAHRLFGSPANHVVLVTGALPGHPERPFVEPVPDEEQRALIDVLRGGAVTGHAASE